MAGVPVVIHDQQPSVLVWLIPALLLFAAAMITLWVSNYRADIREWNKWRRDTLIKLCSDAVEAVQDAEAACRSAIKWNTRDGLGGISASRDFAAIPRAAGRLSSIAERLHLLGAHYLADTCREFKQAAHALESPARQLSTALEKFDGALEESVKEVDKKCSGEGGPGSEIEATQAQGVAECRQSLHDSIVAEPEATYNKALADLDSTRAKFIRRGQIELKSTST